MARRWSRFLLEEGQSVRGLKFAVSSVLVAGLAAGVAACGGGGSSSSTSASTGSSKTLTIYSSLPLQGASRTNSEALVNGIKLALQQANNKAGSYTIKYQSLDDSVAQTGKWDPGQTSSDARKAAQDKSTILYIGEFNSGASAISIPILNRAGIGQISPANTAVGLTSNAAGATPGEPQKYYPTGKRTYVRVVPKDTVQGAAVATVMKSDGCTKPYILNDKEVYGQGLATNATNSLKTQGIPPLGNDGWDAKAANYRSVASKITATAADSVCLGGLDANTGVHLTRDIAAGVATAKFYSPEAFGDPGGVRQRGGGLPASLDSNLQCTVATLSPDSYPPNGK